MTAFIPRKSFQIHLIVKCRDVFFLSDFGL